MIVFKNVSKKFYDGRYGVKNLSLHVKAGETLVILGTSGSGKSTTLRMINRLIEPTSGLITIEGEDILQKDPIQLRRNMGMAIQGTALFPHMTIEENILLVPHLLGWDAEKKERRLLTLLEMLNLDPAYRKLYPNQLSGGQRQRVGVARALAHDPAILLMDEPFGALDPVTRESVQQEFLDIVDQEKTVVFVTHDIFEAVTLGDRIALMDEGELIQLGEPLELIENPKNAFVEAFLGPHVFQLYMLTKKIGPLVEYNDQLDTDIPLPKISIKESLFQALDTFKKKRVETLFVTRKRRVVGKLRKADLIEFMIKILQEQSAMEAVHG